MEDKKKVAIVGGGLVGALNACFLANRGYIVHVFEMRSDIREAERFVGRSINLALSHRGRSALAAVGLEEEIISAGIPMIARMIHDPDGRRRPIPYGTKEQYIMAVDRRRLNELMLSSAEKHSNVKLFFEHTLHRCEFDSGKVEFLRSDGSVYSDSFDLIIGCDGANSAVRREMTRATRMNFSQKYIPHGYIELVFPPQSDGGFAMETNYLHIWPRDDLMMIALPNPDHSFTGTLFMPFEIFDTLKNEEQLMDFYRRNFPDSLELMGEENLKTVYFSNRASALISIKCHPYHVGSKFVIMGDAAHAMVPFYGQGMNCGFEDCLIFNNLLEKHGDKFEVVLPKFTEIRTADAHTICDLAEYNYVEMRKSVNSNLFLLRKSLDDFLHWLMPSYWTPLYTMVSFTRTRYTKCIADRRWQDKVITGTLCGVTACAFVGLASCFYSTIGIPNLITF